MSRKKVFHLRSFATDSNGAVAPDSSIILNGEIAINYAAGNETLFVKNTQNEIARFSNDELNLLKFVTKEELEEAIKRIGGGGKYIIVEELPTEIDSGMTRNIYLVGPDENDNYDMYIVQEDTDSGTYSWLKIGSTGIKLDEYATKDEVSEYFKSYELIETVEPGFFVVDPQFNVGLKLNEDGLFTVSNGGSSGFSESNNIPAPETIVEIYFTTTDPIPTRKDEDNPILAHGRVVIKFDSLSVSKYATIEVQGSSSQYYPKKNFTIAFYNDKLYTEEYEFRLANLPPHSEYVYKANWIDASHCRNIVCNRLWEQIVMSRSGYPKREFEAEYDVAETELKKRFDVGAIGHVDGFPCVLYINDEFYGVGCFNIGKKRNNYLLEKNNQNHIQLAADDHVNFATYEASKWEIRNPKTPGETFADRIAPWFSANNSLTTGSTTDFIATHNITNFIDYYILIEFLLAADDVDKNLMLTSWDGVKFSMMPYDLDSVLGLWWDGTALMSPEGSVLSVTGNNLNQKTISVYLAFFQNFKTDIVDRYNQLKDLGIISVDNMYALCSNFIKKYGEEYLEKEAEKWPDVPSNSTVYTGLSQILDWVEKRIAWLDTYFVL